MVELSDLLRNSAGEAKYQMGKAKKCLLGLVRSSIASYGEMTDKFLQCFESVSTKVVWQENVVPGKTPLEYFELIEESDPHVQKEEAQKIEDMLGELRSRLDLGKTEYYQIAGYLEKQIDMLKKQMNDKYKALSHELHKNCIGLLQNLCSFPSQYVELKKKLKAENSNPEFIRLFQDTFSPKSIAIIDHLFFFFEIFQKTLRDTIIENLEVWGREYDSVMNNIGGKFDEQTKALSKAIDFIEAAQIEMSKAILLIVSESSKSVKFSFEFFEKTVNSLSKVFDALSTHSELTLDEQAEVEEETISSLSEYFALDADFVALHRSKGLLELGDQMILETKFDRKNLQKAIEQLFGNWKNYVAPYLYPLEEQGPIMAKIEQISKSPQSKNMLLSPEINLLVEISDEDVNLASVYKYQTRMNKKALPCSGSLMLMSEYLIFCSKGLAVSANLLIPFTAVVQLQPSKNFLGQQNGLLVGTSRGSFEFFFSDKQAREQLLSKLTLSIESLRVVFSSPLHSLLSYRDCYSSQDGSTASVELEFKDVIHGNLVRTLKKLKLRYLDTSNPIVGPKIDNCRLLDALDTFVEEKSLVFGEREYEGFHSMIKSTAGFKDVVCSKKFQPVQFLSAQEATEAQKLFVQDHSVRQLVFEFAGEEVGQMTERFTVHFSHLDVVAICVSSTCTSRIHEFEGLLLLSQGRLEDRHLDPESSAVFSTMYWKQGTKGFSGIHHIYGQQMLDSLATLTKQRLMTGVRKRQATATMQTP